MSFGVLGLMLVPYATRIIRATTGRWKRITATILAVFLVEYL
jgi:hypothetical protein